jgi:hypothetical protein
MKSFLQKSICAVGTRIILFTALSLVFMSFAKAPSPSATSAIKAAIVWKATEIDLGEIPQNKPVTIEFEFTNTGDSPVIISNVQASCGCTSTDYIKEPVNPGQKTKIRAVFNAAAKGVFKKQVTVITNAEEGPKALTFTGTVI